MPEHGYFNPSKCDLRHLDTWEGHGALSLEDEGRKNEERLQKKRIKHCPRNIPEEVVGTINNPGSAGG